MMGVTMVLGLQQVLFRVADDRHRLVTRRATGWAQRTSSFRFPDSSRKHEGPEYLDERLQRLVVQSV